MGQGHGIVVDAQDSGAASQRLRDGGENGCARVVGRIGYSSAAQTCPRKSRRTRRREWSFVEIRSFWNEWIAREPTCTYSWIAAPRASPNDDRPCFRETSRTH